MKKSGSLRVRAGGITSVVNERRSIGIAGMQAIVSFAQGVKDASITFGERHIGVACGGGIGW